ncbi:hypothetical protein [Streptomyces sp. enrichment culture]|uniref:hypothetical protein n=1 Tax=Streptomyces sp. enrichment culture TaxID=1795815 RepID=UPI003F57A5E2
MNLTLGRRATTAAVTLIAAVGTLLTVGGTASAAEHPAAGHKVVAVSEQGARSHGDDRNTRLETRDGQVAHRVGHDRDSTGEQHRHHRAGREEFRGEHRSDGHPERARDGRDRYRHDRGRAYRYDGVRLYRWDHGRWILTTGDLYGFDRDLLR